MLQNYPGVRSPGLIKLKCDSNGGLFRRLLAITQTERVELKLTPKRFFGLNPPETQLQRK